MAFAFSGAVSEEDLVVARYGIERMKGYIANKSNKQDVDTTTIYQPLATPLKKEQFIQVNIIVDDIHKAAKAWAAIVAPKPIQTKTDNIPYEACVDDFIDDDSCTIIGVVL